MTYLGEIGEIGLNDITRGILNRVKMFDWNCFWDNGIMTALHLESTNGLPECMTSEV